MEIITLPLGPLETNCYLLHNGSEALVIDPGGDIDPVLQILTENDLPLTHIFNTHLHFDHTYGNADLSKSTGVKIQAGEAEELIAATPLSRGGVFELPEVTPYAWEVLQPGDCPLLGDICTVLHTPGHSPGSLSFYFKNAGAVFAGDVIFAGSVGRTDFPGSSSQQLVQSIKSRIFVLPEETIIYPGHGPSTTVKREKKSNPYV